MSQQLEITWQETETVVTEFKQVLTLPDRGDTPDDEWLEIVGDAIRDQAQYEVGTSGPRLYTNGEFIDGNTEYIAVKSIEYGVKA